MGHAKKLGPDALKLSGRYPAGVLEDPEPIAQRFAHAADVRQASVLQRDPQGPSRPVQRAREAVLAAGGPKVRRGVLISALALAALIPCLILGLIWFGSSGEAEPEQTASPSAMQTETPSAILTASERIDATAGGQVTFPIALDGTDAVPSRSVIAVKGLPPGSNFSEGRPFGAREWTLKPDEIGDLQLVLPSGTSGEFKLEITLITPDGEVIADTATLLAIAPAPVPGEPPASVPGSVLSPAAGDPAAIATLPEVGEAAALTAFPEAASNEDAAPGAIQAETEAVTETPADTPSANPEIEQPSEQATAAASGAQPSTVGQPAASESGLGTVEPSMFVNMREAPSSSSAVLGVIAKGATLSVLDRKRGWVQVTHPESGKQGWIYSGLLVGEAKPTYRRKRADLPEAKPETGSESFWDRVGRWLTPDEPADEARVP